MYKADLVGILRTEIIKHQAVKEVHFGTNFDFNIDGLTKYPYVFIETEPSLFTNTANSDNHNLALIFVEKHLEDDEEGALQAQKTAETIMRQVIEHLDINVDSIPSIEQEFDALSLWHHESDISAGFRAELIFITNKVDRCNINDLFLPFPIFLSVDPGSVTFAVDVTNPDAQKGIDHYEIFENGAKMPGTDNILPVNVSGVYDIICPPKTDQFEYTIQAIMKSGNQVNSKTQDNKFFVFEAPSCEAVFASPATVQDNGPGGVEIQWNMTTDVNVANYRIEVSIDGAPYGTVGNEAGDGSGTYSFTDPSTNPLQRCYRVIAECSPEVISPTPFQCT